jgi:hypothetical protein
MVRNCRTSITRDPRNLNKCIVTVVGKKGHGTFYCRNWQNAVMVARHYAAMFDAPCKVI